MSNQVHGSGNLTTVKTEPSGLPGSPSFSGRVTAENAATSWFTRLPPAVWTGYAALFYVGDVESLVKLLLAILTEKKHIGTWSFSSHIIALLRALRNVNREPNLSTSGKYASIRLF